jgi:uncharacterized DUF497 family protein
MACGDDGIALFDGFSEDRWFTLGYDASGNLLAVSHTYEVTGPTNVRLRIIAARKAT